MKKLLIIIGKLYHRVFGRVWITGKDCKRVPVYLVEDERVFVVARTLRVKK